MTVRCELEKPFNQIMREKKDSIDKHLASYFNGNNGSYEKELNDAMNYSLRAGGKRLRPIIIVETARVFSGDLERTLPFAAAIEMIHTYSLIHDDLPAMDNDDLRRGKPTNHIVFGQAKAILAGDGLLNSAHTIMLERTLEETSYDWMRRCVRASHEISEKAGVKGMILGQIADIANEDTKVDIETLNYINKYKTGALIEAAFASGAMLGGANDEEISKMRKVAQNIGLSFQIIDDILDIEGDTDIIGKPTGSDEKNEKTTYPSLIGLEPSRNKAKELTEEAIQILKALPYDTEFLECLVVELLSRKL